MSFLQYQKSARESFQRTQESTTKKLPRNALQAIEWLAKECISKNPLRDSTHTEQHRLQVQVRAHSFMTESVLDSEECLVYKIFLPCSTGDK